MIFFWNQIDIGIQTSDIRLCSVENISPTLIWLSLFHWFSLVFCNSLRFIFGQKVCELNCECSLLKTSSFIKPLTRIHRLPSIWRYFRLTLSTDNDQMSQQNVANKKINKNLVNLSSWKQAELSKKCAGICINICMYCTSKGESGEERAREWE